MTMPRFFSRIADALTPIAGLDTDALAAHLDTVTVHIHAPQDPDRARATLLAVNLAARLYPHLVLHGGPPWLGQARELAVDIHPGIDVTLIGATAEQTMTDDAINAVRRSGGGDAASDRREFHLIWEDPGAPDIIGISASGWTVTIDPPRPVERDRDARTPEHNAPESAHPRTCAAAVAIGMGELFRAAFAEPLAERGRTGPQPGSLHLITGETPTQMPEPTAEQNALPASVALPPVTLVGAGAVGQACLWALILADVEVTVTVVDPEPVTLSNLQRYLFTDDHSEGTSKVDLAEAAATASALTIVAVPTPWGADERSGPGTQRVLAALDTAADRIAVAAALPDAAYNAWTQPADIGWSRHEQFGIEPCLACLYYPDRPRPSEHELIADALQDHPLRMLTYLVTNTPVGAPLAVLVSLPDLPPPAGADQWRTRSLLDDLVARERVSPQESTRWATMSIGQLYRDGICAGGLLRLPNSSQPEDALVPLAHQSALAGIMLAITYYASQTPELRDLRASTVEARFDVLRGFPQVVNRPRQRTPGCLCTDPNYITGSREAYG